MHITIVGDSWGYYWDKHGNQCQGLKNLLTAQGHTVSNLALPGKSNLETINELIEQQSSTDCVLFIQTEPVREWFTGRNAKDHCGRNNRPLLDAESLFKLVLDQGSVKQVLENYLKNTIYPKLEQWQEQQSAPVLIIGGCSDVDTDLLPKCLTCVVDSWPQLLLGSDRFEKTMFFDTGQWLSWEYAELVHQSKNVDLMVEWYEITKKVNEKQIVWANDTQYFNPDKWHPNLAGHQVLADHLKPILDQINNNL